MGNYDGVLTDEEVEKYRSETIVMEDEDSFTQLLEYLQNYKGEPKWIEVRTASKNAEKELKLIDSNVSRFW